MQKQLYLLAAFLFLFSAAAIGQTATVKGFVYDKKTGEPMIYTNVIFQGTKYGAQTDLNGYFSITLPVGTYNLYTTTVGYDTASVSLTLKAGDIISRKLFISQYELELKGVEISARKTERQTHINTGVTTITPRDIKLLPSAGGEPDVAQSLQTVPGVVFTGDQGGQLYIRGGSPAQTGIMLDGVTIYNPFHSIGLFSVFETESIRNVDVYSAGFNAEYGNRTSAIVDVHTKDGNKNELAGIVSVSPIMTRAMLEGPLVKSKKHNGAGITFLLYGKDSYLDQTSKSVYGGLGDQFKAGLPYYFSDFYGKVTFNGDNGSKLNLFGFSFNDDAKLMGADTVAADYKWSAKGGGATFVVSPGSSTALIDGKFAYSKYDITLTNQAMPATPSTSSIDGFEAGINFTYYLPNYSELKYGVEVSGFHTSLSYLKTANSTTTLDEQSTLASTFAVFRKNFGGKFIMEPSLRIQYYSELSQISPEPRLGLKYNISENVRIKAAAGIYSQNIVSTKNDIDIVNFFTGFSLAPQDEVRKPDGSTTNSNLQTAYHAAGGIEVDIHRVELNLEPWYKNFSTLTELNRAKLYPQDPDWIDGYASAYGIDLSAKYDYKRVYLWAAVSYQEIKYTGVDVNGNSQTYPPPFDRRINVNLLGAYTVGQKRDWELSLRYNMGSPFPFTQTQGFYENLNVLNNGINSSYLTQNGTLGILYANEIDGGRLSYYHRLDFSVKKHFPLSKKVSLDGTASVTNIVNRQNVFFIDRVTNATTYQLPIFPSVNVTLNF